MGGARTRHMTGTVYSVVLALVLAGLLWLVLRDARALLTGAPAAAALAGQGLTALTDGPVLDGFGSWSPDGEQIAFMRSGQIWVMPAGGGQGRALTGREGMWDTVPVWHPEGGQIALIRLSPDRSEGRIVLVSLQSGQEQELARELEPIGSLAWAPDGSHLYYTTATGLKRLNISRRQAVPVLELDSRWDLLAGGLAVARDGHTVIFGAGRKEDDSTRYDLWRLDLDASGAAPQQMTRDGGIMPALDSAGRRLVYRNPRQRTGIYVMELEKQTVRQIVADERGALYFHPRFSPDGQQLLVSRLRLAAAAGQRGQGSYLSHLYVVRLNGSDR